MEMKGCRVAIEMESLRDSRGRRYAACGSIGAYRAKEKALLPELPVSKYRTKGRCLSVVESIGFRYAASVS